MALRRRYAIVQFELLVGQDPAKTVAALPRHHLLAAYTVSGQQCTLFFRFPSPKSTLAMSKLLLQEPESVVLLRKAVWRHRLLSPTSVRVIFDEDLFTLLSVKPRSSVVP